MNYELRITNYEFRGDGHMNYELRITNYEFRGDGQVNAYCATGQRR